MIGLQTAGFKKPPCRAMVAARKTPSVGPPPVPSNGRFRFNSRPISRPPSNPAADWIPPADSCHRLYLAVATVGYPPGAVSGSPARDWGQGPERCCTVQLPAPTPRRLFFHYGRGGVGGSANEWGVSGRLERAAFRGARHGPVGALAGSPERDHHLAPTSPRGGGGDVSAIGAVGLSVDDPGRSGRHRRDRAAPPAPTSPSPRSLRLVSAIPRAPTPRPPPARSTSRTRPAPAAAPSNGPVARGAPVAGRPKVMLRTASGHADRFLLSLRPRSSAA